LNEIIDVMKIQANNKGLYMKLEHNTKVPYMIRTDPNRLKQVILNLLSNAIKFTETGGITIST
jgi:signal transduction histidine kinase